MRCVSGQSPEQSDVGQAEVQGRSLGRGSQVKHNLAVDRVGVLPMDGREGVREWMARKAQHAPDPLVNRVDVGTEVARDRPTDTRLTQGSPGVRAVATYNGKAIARTERAQASESGSKDFSVEKYL